jgi:hypothetical protein
MAGSVQLLRFSEDEEAAYAESAVGMVAVQDPAAVTALSAVWADVASAAPSPKRSADMIRAAMERWA